MADSQNTPSSGASGAPFGVLMPDLPSRPLAGGGVDGGGEIETTPRRYLWEAGGAEGAQGTGDSGRLVRGAGVALPIDLLCGVDSQKERLRENTRRFAEGLSAHHTILWGARGTGKSSLVKSVHALFSDSLSLIGVLPCDADKLATLFAQLAPLAPNRFLIFLDDLTLRDDDGYHTLKVVLDGGVSEVPRNCLLYVTSNRRHLTDRKATETESARALRPEEVVEDKVSLADRFGLSLGFYPLPAKIYLQVVRGYWSYAGFDVDSELDKEAEQFSRLRGGLSGRTALQFVRDYAARQNKPFPL